MSSNSQRLVIRTDITDWRQEVEDSELTVRNREDVVDELERGVSTPELARAAVVSRELGLQQGDEVLRPNKLLLLSGAVQDIAHIATSQRKPLQIKAKRAHEHQFRTMLGQPRTKQQAKVQGVAPQSYTLVETDPQAEARIDHYLFKVALGHVFERFKQYHAIGVDVRAKADEFKRQLDAKVAELE